MWPQNPCGLLPCSSAGTQCPAVNALPTYFAPVQSDSARPLRPFWITVPSAMRRFSPVQSALPMFMPFAPVALMSSWSCTTYLSFKDALWSGCPGCSYLAKIALDGALSCCSLM